MRLPITLHFAAVQQRLKNRADSEHEQVLARIFIGSAYLGYVFYLLLSGRLESDVSHILVIALLFVMTAFIMFSAIVVWPAISVPRRVFGMCLDLGVLTYSMYLMGEAGAVLFSISLWIVIGNGLRYGQRYLYTAMALANMGFVFVMVENPFWIQHRTMAVGLLVGLVVLPIFFSSLLGRLNRSNDKLKKLGEDMTRLAMHDTVTGLPNRALLQERLNQAIAGCQRYNRILAVLFIDLDGFKAVNDRWGHKLGDDLLRVVAGRITSSVRRTDTVARLGGDEFVVLLVEISGPDDATTVADKILAQFRLPFDIDQQQVSVGASIGIAIYPVSGENAELLIRNADQAMYQAKRNGKNNINVHSTNP